MVILRDGRDVLFQWDLDIRAAVLDPDVQEVHFVSSARSDEALVVAVKDRLASIPNSLLQEPGKLYAYESIDGIRTGAFSVFTIQPRAKPTDYVYTETEIKRFETLEKKLDELLGSSLAVEAITTTDIDLMMKGVS